MPGAPAAVSAVALREATFADYDQISSLVARSGIRPRDREEWQHVWVNNAEYLRQENWPIGWVLETADSRVVGTVLNIPLAYEFEGKRLAAAAGRAWVVEEQYRGYALLLLDEFFSQPAVDLFLNTTVNRHAEQAYQTFDSPRVPKGHWDRSAFWVTNYRRFAASAIKRKGLPCGLLLRYPIAAGLFVGDRLQSGRIRGSRDLEVRAEPHFDERFDAFWEELRQRKRLVLLGIRTRETLAWHFHFGLRRGDVWILTAHAKGRLVAYAIFDRKDKADYGLTRVRLVDYQSLVDGYDPLRSLVAGMIEICAKSGVQMLEDRGCAFAGELAPYRRKLPSWLYYYKASPALTQRLKDPAIWEPSLYDGDSTL